VDLQADLDVIDGAVTLRNSLQHISQQTDLDEIITPDLRQIITAIKDALADTPPEVPVHQYSLELPPSTHLKHVGQRANLPEVIAALNDAVVALPPSAISIPSQRTETLLEQRSESPRWCPATPEGTPPSSIAVVRYQRRSWWAAFVDRLGSIFNFASITTEQRNLTRGFLQGFGGILDLSGRSLAPQHTPFHVLWNQLLDVPDDELRQVDDAAVLKVRQADAPVSKASGAPRSRTESPDDE
jgi:hypothetical protein